MVLLFYTTSEVYTKFGVVSPYMPMIYCYFENKTAAACATSALNKFCSICTAFRCLHRIWDRPGTFAYYNRIRIYTSNPQGPPPCATGSGRPTTGRAPLSPRILSAFQISGVFRLTFLDISISSSEHSPVHR